MRRFYILFCGGLFCFFVLVLFRTFRHEPPNFIALDGKEHVYNIYPNTTLDSLFHLLAADYKIGSRTAWEYTCQKNKLKRIKPGHYVLPARIGSKQLLRYLITNSQVPIRLTFTNIIRTKNDLAKTLAKQLMLDSLDILNRLNDSLYMAKYGLSQNTAISLFLPNTYEVYWTISPDQLFDKMQVEYTKFWNKERLARAAEMNLSPSEVAIIASIVECESNQKNEYGQIARLYINRLQKGMHLQADPTAVFAVGDFSIRRVLKEHLNYDSPYNTYVYKGLPPGPIRCVNATTLDAVLNAPESDVLYMCARDDRSGYHHFSTSYLDHSTYARRYRRMLNELKVK